jgi:hypothetical protein
MTETLPIDTAPDAPPVVFVVSGADKLLTVNGSQIVTHWQPDMPPPVGYFEITIRSYQYGYTLGEAKFVLQIIPDESDAEAYVTMAVMRRGVEEESFSAVPSPHHQDAYDDQAV